MIRELECSRRKALHIHVCILDSLRHVDEQMSPNITFKVERKSAAVVDGRKLYLIA